TLDGLAAGQLQYACAGFDGRYYRVAVAQSGYTTNNLEIKFNVIEKRLEPFGVRGAVSSTGIACYWSSETSGQWDLYVGTQSMGQVYKLDQENYDELPEESYTTLGTLDRPIDANPAKRGAQSFKLSNYNSVESINISAAYLRLKKVSGTTTDLTVRIETDNNGEPSGTLADTDATSTVSAFTGTSYSWIKAVFSNVTLSGNTTYWLVVKHVTEGTGNSKYAWAGDACSPTYINGNSSMYQVVTTAATVTFNPDADPESTSVDGAVYRILRDGIGEDFSTIRSGAGTNVYSGGLPDYPFAGTYLSSFCTSPNFDSMDRAILLFDTSSLPDDASISAATLSLYVADKNDDYAQDVCF
ncbi:hypothetical protein M1146_07775, partial [Patescibacteria group bacterium]|nr:hypothetical protein [Patescibacteria group bacterium]